MSGEEEESGEEEKKEGPQFLSYKDPTGKEVCEPLVLGSSPEKDIEDRIAVLERRGCTAFVQLDADKQPIEKPE